MPREFIVFIGMGLIAGLALSLLRAGGLITFLAMWLTFLAVLLLMRISPLALFVSPGGLRILLAALCLYSLLALCARWFRKWSKRRLNEAV
jgi:hypothetical protein